jgi:polynucleotide 5'-kinase involved in rRNA processing
MGRKNDLPDPSTYNNIVDGLKTLYKRKIRPLEEAFKFDAFHSNFLTDTDIQAKPFVLVLGQYSVGKSSFVQYLLDRDYPGCHIGPVRSSDESADWN